MAMMAPDPAVPLRERRRVTDMRRVQLRAVKLFEEHGYEEVSVERVAEAAGVSPVSIYRWFGAKERLVLWDDYDPGLLAAVAERLADLHPLEAVRDAVIAELGRVYDADRDLVLARTKLLFHEPSLLAAAMRDAWAMQEALVELFGREQVAGDGSAHRVLAGAAVGVLTVAIDGWQRQDGHRPLAEHVDEGFEVLRAVSWTR